MFPEIKYGTYYNGEKWMEKSSKKMKNKVKGIIVEVRNLQQIYISYFMYADDIVILFNT